MNARIWSAGLLALGGLLLAGAAARAEDTIKLGLPARDDAPAVSLGKLSADAETIDTHFRGGYGGRYYGGYGGRFGGYGGRYFGYSYYPRYYYPRYYYPRPYLYSYYYPTPTYYYPAPVYYPISAPSGKVMPSADALNVPYNPRETIPPPRPLLEGQSFPYDGNPRQPQPALDPAPTRSPVAPRAVPLDGRPVSLPARTATPVKLSYPAFGELPR